MVYSITGDGRLAGNLAAGLDADGTVKITDGGYWCAPFGWSGLIVSASSASGLLERCFAAQVGGSPMRCAA